MKKLTLAYFGSPYFSALFLEKILTDPDLKKIIEVKFVVTQPDRPIGRKQILIETPVKTVAKKYGIKLFENKSKALSTKFETNLKSKIINQKRFKHLNLKNWKLFGIWDLEFRIFYQIDLCLVYAFSQIIPKELLKAPKLGFWNIHPSLLPKYRGPSPITYSLIFGEKETGVTIFKMDEKIDHGPIIAQKKLKIKESDRRPDLEKKLTNLGFQVLQGVILNLFQDLKTRFRNGFGMTSTPQHHTQATYTRLLKKQDGFIPLSTLKKALKNEPLEFEELPPILKEIRNWKLEIRNSSEIFYNYFRGLSPWPGLWTLIPNGKRLKIIDMNFNVASYKLHVTRVQLEGKKEVDFETFNRAYRVF